VARVEEQGGELDDVGVDRDGRGEGAQVSGAGESLPGLLRRLPVGHRIHHFASDLRQSKAKVFWASQRSASMAAFDTPSNAAAWKKIPSWYFISTGDQIITPASELAMARRAHSHITMFRGGSHLTLISHPNAVIRRHRIGDLLAALITQPRQPHQACARRS
jgi:pimeloyl-ACP methyl ester carboxylesterase